VNGDQTLAVELIVNVMRVTAYESEVWIHLCPLRWKQCPFVQLFVNMFGLLEGFGRATSYFSDSTADTVDISKLSTHIATATHVFLAAGIIKVASSALAGFSPPAIFVFTPVYFVARLFSRLPVVLTHSHHSCVKSLCNLIQNMYNLSSDVGSCVSFRQHVLASTHFAQGVLFPFIGRYAMLPSFSFF
jgi:hypothetical protein